MPSPASPGAVIIGIRVRRKVLTLEVPKETDGSISAHIGSADGKPFLVHPWVQIVSVDEDRYMSAYVDADGYFEASGLEPGRYLVGLMSDARCRVGRANPNTGPWTGLKLSVSVKTRTAIRVRNLARSFPTTNRPWLVSGIPRKKNGP